MNIFSKSILVLALFLGLLSVSFSACKKQMEDVSFRVVRGMSPDEHTHKTYCALVGKNGDIKCDMPYIVGMATEIKRMNQKHACVRTFKLYCPAHSAAKVNHISHGHLNEPLEKAHTSGNPYILTLSNKNSKTEAQGKIEFICHHKHHTVTNHSPS